MATPIYDLICKTTLGSVPVGSAGIKKAHHRELVIPAKTNATTKSLKFVDSQHTCYVIPLGESPTRKRDAPPRGHNKLAPIIPLCYTSPDCDPKNAKYPRSGGYIYIYINGYLFRELEVFSEGKYRDINLQQYQGKDTRPATVEIDSRILVPHMVAGVINTIMLCYSEIQWSWTRINTLGGMDPNDFRLDVDDPPPLASDVGISKASAEKNRTARLQQLDLSGFNDGYPTIEPHGNFARTENANNPTATLWDLVVHKKSGMPLVYLHDPMGIAMDHVHEYFNVHADFLQQVAMAKNTPHFKSAVYAYHTFFNEKLWSKQASQQRGARRAPDRFTENTDSGNMLRNAASEIDREYLEETTLRVTERKELRQWLRDIKKSHVEFLNGDYNGEKITDSNPDFVTINAALKDYAELNGHNYIVLWSAVQAFICFLNHDPASIDAALDIKANHDRPAYADDPGAQYLESLLDPAHELHALLFPKQSDVDEYQEDYDIAGKQPEALDGTAQFRPVAFAAIFNTPFISKQDSVKAFGDIIKYAKRVVTDFDNAFKAQWQRRTETNINANAIIRLTKASNMPELAGLHIVPKGATIGDKVIIDAKVSTMRPILSKVKNLVSENKKGFVKVVDPTSKKVIGYLDPHQVPNYKGAPIQFTQGMWDDLFVNNQSGAAVARLDLIAVSATSKYALDWHNPGITGDVKIERTNNGLRIAGKYLPAMVAVMEVFNLVGANKQFQKTFTIKDGLKLILSGAGLIHATTSATIALTSEAKMATLFEKGFKRFSRNLGIGRAGQKISEDVGRYMIAGKHFLGFKVSTMAGTGALLSGAGAVMSGWDAVDSFSADDTDAGAAYSVQALAMGGLMVSGLLEGSVIFMGMGPVGWAFLAVGLLAGILAALLTDTPLEKWAKHGPFAKDPANRMTGDLATITKDNTGKEITTAKSGSDTLEALLHLLMMPSIKMKQDNNTTPNTVVVEMTAPGFSVGTDTLEIYTTQSQSYSHGHTSVSYRNETVIKPAATENIIKTETGEVLGIKYYYVIPPDGKYKFETRGRVITAEQIYIPKKVSVEHTSWKRNETNRRGSIVTTTDTQSELTIDQRDPNWVYAKPIVAALS